MAYIGKQPLVGNFVKLDTITTSATTTFNLTNGGVAYYPQSANNCLVSLNGILQAPTDSYTISGSTIVFSSALTTNDVIDFIIVLGDVLNIGTPSDNTVSLAKLTATGTKDSTTFLRGDNTFASAVSAGAVLQVVSATDSTIRNTTSSTYVTGSNTLSVSITPSSASNKILILCSTAIQATGSGEVNVTIYRNSTNLAGTGGFSYSYDTVAYASNNIGINYLDSPNTTSAITYQLYFKITSGTGQINVSNSGNTGSITCMEIKG